MQSEASCLLRTSLTSHTLSARELERSPREIAKLLQSTFSDCEGTLLQTSSVLSPRSDSRGSSERARLVPRAPESLEVLVVIPTLNEARHIRGVVTHLLADPLAESGLLTIVVADGGSDDGTREMVLELASTFPEVHLLDNPKRLQSAGLNRAVRLFGLGKTWLLRCDAHATYPKAFCSSLVATAQRVEADAVVVPLDSQGRGSVAQAIAWLSNSKLGTGGSAHRAGTQSQFVDHGHHALFRLDSFVRAGGYDETLACNEDAELDCRLRLLGSPIFLDAAVRVGYFCRSTFGGLARQYFRYGQGRSRTVRRHPGSLRLRQLAVPLHFIASLLALTLAPLFPALLLYPLAYLSVLVGASLWFAITRRALSGLLVGPAALVMHASWAAGFLWECLTVRERPFDAVSFAKGARE